MSSESSEAGDVEGGGGEGAGVVAGEGGGEAMKENTRAAKAKTAIPKQRTNLNQHEATLEENTNKQTRPTRDHMHCSHANV
jgi:hypothetical protein